MKRRLFLLIVAVVWLSALSVLRAQTPLTFDPASPPTSSAPPTELYNEYTGTFSHEKGPKTVIVFLVEPSDGAAWSNAPTYSTFNTQLNTASQNYYNSSYRQTWFGPKRRNGLDIERLVVTPVMRLPKTSAQYLNSFGTLQVDSWRRPVHSEGITRRAVCAITAISTGRWSCLIQNLSAPRVSPTWAGVFRGPAAASPGAWPCMSGATTGAWFTPMPWLSPKARLGAPPLAIAPNTRTAGT